MPSWWLRLWIVPFPFPGNPRCVIPHSSETFVTSRNSSRMTSCHVTRDELIVLFVDAAWHQRCRGFPASTGSLLRLWVIQVHLGSTKMLFHNSSSDSENSQDTAEVVSPASVSTAIDLLVASVLLLFFDKQDKARSTCTERARPFDL